MYQSKYEWKVRRRSSDMPDDLIDKFKLNPLEQTILENRGYTTESDLERIYRPKTYDPSLVYGMADAVARIETAFDADERILIYGDFDADGITSTVLLLNALRRRTENVDYFIPSRIEDGYGPNRAVFEELVVGQYDLVITVDNGVSGGKEIAFLKSEGIETIVVDHHAFGDNVPDATIIHPDHPDGTYPFRSLAGVGITYKLVQALGLEAKEDIGWVAIGTVADLVPMIDENKKLVIEGLKVLNDSPPTGVHTLLRSAGHDGQMDEETIAFTLAPRLNATGRLGEAEIAVELLLESDSGVAYEQAMVVENMNLERKQLVETIFDEAKTQVEPDRQINIVYQDGWHPGVLGIVASKIVEQYGKPAIVLTLDDGIYRGSARSIEGVDLHGVLSEHSNHHHRFGGHAQALGVEVLQADIESFTQELTGYFDQLQLDLRPVKYIDYQIKQGNMTMKAFERFDRLKPFGQSFQSPVFLISNENISTIRQVGKDKSHIKLSVAQVGMDVIGFGYGHLVNEVSQGDAISLVGTVNVNVFNQSRTLQMMLQDVSVDSVQLIDMRSRTDQRFDIISSDDIFVIAEGREKKGENYYHFGEVLPFTSKTVVLRDLPESVDNLAYSLGGIHASKIISIFNQKEELFFTGIPKTETITELHRLIESADDGSIDLAKHAPALAGRLGIKMKFLKMSIDIMTDLEIIRVEDGIIYKDQGDSAWRLEESAYYQNLRNQLEAERLLKMSSSTELKDYLRTLISN
ncbi:single-stranded-DNA-specific exonuclease RecJ [Salinicoccus cyprini]|uniref:Single-stranded-DNA-specific exonuclease RecJ n=1 Tax=Salinicoccus cyprini TaxID=2493691 RepID=A0A558AYI1_9STAP|nr:single-stranded-DNA-specific exonuclease RecJ [Salinicoccus cyprini]TVT29326.1 single-stranded-DNA-specific exonuclease RecJ [Salinicoccus cyprini]